MRLSVKSTVICVLKNFCGSLLVEFERSVLKFERSVC
jgi:hypothetical protein